MITLPLRQQPGIRSPSWPGETTGRQTDFSDLIKGHLPFFPAHLTPVPAGTGRALTKRAFF